jgi:hypothetical protein
MIMHMTMPRPVMMVMRVMMVGMVFLGHEHRPVILLHLYSDKGGFAHAVVVHS